MPEPRAAGPVGRVHVGVFIISFFGTVFWAPGPPRACIGRGALVGACISFLLVCSGAQSPRCLAVFAFAVLDHFGAHSILI